MFGILDRIKQVFRIFGILGTIRTKEHLETIRSVASLRPQLLPDVKVWLTNSADDRKNVRLGVT